MDSFKELLGTPRRIEEAIEGEDVVKKTMRTRIEDYGSVLQVLQDATPVVLEHDLERLQCLFIEIEELHAQYTAGP